MFIRIIPGPSDAMKHAGFGWKRHSFARAVQMPGLCGHCRQKKVEKHKKKELGFAVTSPVLFLLENKIIKNTQKN